jgi:hypothetical protein
MERERPGPMDSDIASHPFLLVAALAGLIAAYGIYRDVRHSRRADLNAVSLIAWGKLSSVALIVAIVCLAMGLRTGG